MWRQSRLGRNTGNKAGLIKQIQDRCGLENYVGEEHKTTGRKTELLIESKRNHKNLENTERETEMT